MHLEVPPTPRQPTSNIPTTNTSTSVTAAPINPTDSRWISSLRRRDPELQPTLPSINHHLSHNNVGFSIPNDKRGRSSKMSSGVRKSRSVERFRARKVKMLLLNIYILTKKLLFVVVAVKIKRKTKEKFI